MPVSDEEYKDWLIELMYEAKYHPDPGGMCFGIANMGMQAILAEEFNLFEERFLELIDIYDERDEIHKVIEILKEEAINPTKQLRDDPKKTLINTLKLEEKLRELRKTWTAHLLRVEKIDFSQLKEELNKKENEFLYPIFIEQELEQCKNELGKLKTELTNPESDYLAFFEGTEIYQRLWLHSYLLEKGKQIKQDTLLSAPLALSKKLEQSGGICRIGSFIGGYNSDELFQYFSTLKKELDGIKEPIVLILGSGDHAITVGYDPTKNEWLFVNGSRKPEHIPGDNLQKVAQNIMDVFAMGNQCSFVTNIYCNKSNEEEFKKRIVAWEKQPKFQEIHRIDAKKVKQSGSHLLLLAAMENDPIIVKKLIKEGMNPNLVADENGNTPFLIAVCCNHIEVMAELLACPKKITMSLNVQVDSLYKFAREAQIYEHSIDELVKKKIGREKTIDSTTVISFSLHELATALGYTEISNLLSQYEQKEPGKTNSDNFVFFKTEEYLSSSSMSSSKPSAEKKTALPNPFENH
ncbi:ankyrin repeat domain-containing protein [Legionella steigerwaltii]|uniref:ankyrin repeat domain-containing protein n=1 Tax=Legionella steigerwaltii TaxID=460 RepID=UPI0007319160|nr:ankyrin repeat domain-containing protein [Legionella steigerwaltii]